MKKKYDEHKKSCITWLKTKGIALGIGVLIIGVFFLGKWFVTLPYNTYNYLNIGYWGLIVGGFLLFILLNIILGVVFTIFQSDEDSIYFIEAVCGFASLAVILFTYLTIVMELSPL